MVPIQASVHFKASRRKKIKVLGNFNFWLKKGNKHIINIPKPKWDQHSSLVAYWLLVPGTLIIAMM